MQELSEIYGEDERKEVSDEKLIAEIARMWVDNGGDADGIDWCKQKLKDSINQEIARRSEAAEE